LRTHNRPRPVAVVALLVGGVLVLGGASSCAGSGTGSRKSVAQPARTTSVIAVTAGRRGCRPAPRLVVAHVASGLAFPGGGALQQARVIAVRRAVYFAARIIPPGNGRPVGIGVWAMRSLSPTAPVVAVNAAAAGYSDWRRADRPLTAAIRARVRRARSCVG
jgi:hypothetical protein